MREAKLPTVPRKTERVTRMPAETVRPSNYRPPRHDDTEDKKQDNSFAELFLRSTFSFIAGYEIQARCGVYPLTSREAGALAGYREFAGKDSNGVLRDALQAATDKLVDAQSCDHCMMRSECAFRRGGHNARS